MAASRYMLADYAIIFLAIAIITSRLISSAASPIVQIGIRWIMRLSVCLFLTFTIFALSTQPQIRPFWSVFLCAFLGYFLIESIYVWSLIRIYSNIDFPLFPRFSSESETIMWVSGNHAQKIRSIIQRAGFKFSETLAIKSSTISILISPIFYSKHGHIRLQVLFPNFRKKRRTLMTFILTTYLRNGTILVTHNMQSPASIFFTPPFDTRFFNISSIKRLINIHRKRIKKHVRRAFCLSGENCPQVINHEQAMLEEANLANGNCVQLEGHTNINLSFAGRYRLWVSMLRLNYLGI